MKKFLYIISALAFTISANAQNAGGLFPELQKREQKQQQVQQFDPNAPIPELFGNETPEQIKTQQERLEQLKKENTGITSVSEQIDATTTGEEKRKVKKGQENFIIITPEEVQIITPSVQRFQFCRAGLTLLNNTKYNIKNVKITADYSPVQMPLTFGSTPAGGSYSGRFFLAGTACQGLLGTPKITVDVCQADGMTVEECKSAIKYITDLKLAKESQL